MAQDWLEDVRRYATDADENVVNGIVKYCGIALLDRDSSLVAMSDVTERALVRQNYLKKKLGLTSPDAVLDQAVVAVGQMMKADRTKNRVTVYYLLAQHFGMLGIFARNEGSSTAVAAFGSGAVAPAVAAPLAASSLPKSDAMVARPLAKVGKTREDFNFIGWGCGIAALLIGAIIVAALLAWYADRPAAPPSASALPTATTMDPTRPVALAEAIPEGAGVISAERNGKPMLTVYFDTAKSDVAKDLATAAAKLKDYVANNAGAKLAVSGFNDPTGNAAGNAELSKRRAQAVSKALEDAGIPATAIELVKPNETTDTSGDNDNARRVEVKVE